VNFTTPLFVFVVLPLILGSYWLCLERWRNPLLLAWGMALYAWGAPEFVLVVGLVAAFDWLLAFRIAAAAPGSRRRKALTTFGVGVNLAVLAVAKYANFGVEILDEVRALFGQPRVPWVEIALPIGVSFVVFEKISYLVDVSRSTVQPLGSLHSYLLYTFLFPKMLAGPIVRFHTIRDQLGRRIVDDEGRAYGLARFAVGLAKKVLLADTLGAVADSAFARPPGELNMATAWLGAVAFTLQVYFDFSGYSDMAIGMARCVGFRLAENFRYPYSSASLREFWERWHISLSSWIREYLYIPLGGNRGGELRTYRNLWISFLACGLWHGANWTFLLWGVAHGLGLSVERYRRRRSRQALRRGVAVPLTFLFIVVTMVLFRAPSLAAAVAYYRSLVWLWSPVFIQVFVDTNAALTLVLGLILSLAPAFPWFARLEAWAAFERRGALAMKACAAPLLLLAAARALGTDANPFLYFRF